jgi:hypothetical protein
VRRVVDGWIPLEYCCCWLTVNPEAATEVVAKAVAPGFAQVIGPRPRLSPSMAPSF